MDTRHAHQRQARRKPRHSQAHYLRGALMMIYRILNKHPGLADDEQGRTFLRLLLALGLPLSEVDHYASWITAPDLQAIKRAAKRFEATSTSIGEAIKLTDAFREMHGWRMKDGKRVRTSILLIRPYDVDWEVVQRRRRIEKIIKRRTERQAVMTRIATYPARQAAIMSAIERVRQQPGCFTPFAQVIIRAMTKAERAAFPASEASFRRTFDREVAALEELGVVQTGDAIRGATRTKGRPARLIWPTDLWLSVATKDTQEFRTRVDSVVAGKKRKPIKPLEVEQFGTNHDADVVMVPQTDTTDVEAQLRAQVERLRQELDRRDAVIIRKGASNA